MCEKLARLRRRGKRRTVSHHGQGSCRASSRRSGASGVALEAAIAESHPVSELAVIQLPLLYDAERRSVQLAARRDGTPCERPVCEYAFAFVTPRSDPARTEEAERRQLRVHAVRHVVHVRFEEARFVDCLEVPEIDERSLRENHPEATAGLRKLGDAGADVVLIRGMRGRPIGLLFTRSIGHRVHVLDEAETALRPDGSWERLVLEPEPVLREGWRATVHAPRWNRLRRRSPRIAGELALALTCFLLAPLIAGALATEVTLPVWSELLLAVFAGSLVAAALSLRRRLRPVADEPSPFAGPVDAGERARPGGREWRRELLDLFAPRSAR